MSVVALLLILFGMVALLTLPAYWYGHRRIKSDKPSTTSNDSLYANLYDSIYLDNEKFMREMKLLPTSEASYVLDVGCGTGNRVGITHNVVGVDISPAMVGVAKKRYPKKTFVVGDVLNSETFDKETFTDVWCLGNTVYSLPEKMVFFQNVHRWLEKKGTLVLQLNGLLCKPSAYNKNFKYELNRVGNTCRERLQFQQQKALVETTFYYVSAERILAIADRVGFKVERTDKDNSIYFLKKTDV